MVRRTLCAHLSQFALPSQLSSRHMDLRPVATTTNQISSSLHPPRRRLAHPDRPPRLSSRRRLTPPLSSRRERPSSVRMASRLLSPTAPIIARSANKEDIDLASHSPVPAAGPEPAGAILALDTGPRAG